MSQNDSGRPAQQGANRRSAPAGPERSWTVLELLRWTTRHFESLGIENARLDAECLLAHALGSERVQLYIDFEKPVTQAERARYRELVRRRGADRIPVSQLVGRKEFWSLSLRVSADVLTPRPDTETLVEAALDHLALRDHPYDVLEIGTGSGAIALALLHERPRCHVTATDISVPALQIAALNAEELHVGEAVCFLEGDLFEPVAGKRFDLIVSNPPYLARSSRQELPAELTHEPEQALFGGEDGYSVLRPLVAGADAGLAPGGWLVVEVDPGQAERVAGWCTEAGVTEIETRRDLARRPRAIAARRPSGG